MRIFSFLFFLILFISCENLTFSKKKNGQTIDTIVDLTSVDMSPSFKACDSIIDKKLKSDCFRNTIYKKISIELQKHTLSVKDSINEIIFVDLLINSKGKIVLDDVKLPEAINKKLPKLDSLLSISIEKLPVIYPAIKMGIPVTTKYQLPIKILLKE